MPLRIAETGAALTPLTRGALGVMAAMFLFVCMDTVAKTLGEDLPSLQVVWARYTSQTVLIVLLCLPRLASVARTAHLKLQLVRSLLLFAATCCFFTALQFLELAEATALIETAPLIITLLAAWLLGEQVGPRRKVAVVIGLLGALVLIRPGLGVFQPAGLFALSAAVFLAGYQIATRFLGNGDRLWTTLLYTTGAGAVLASMVVPFLWVPPTREQWVMMALMGVPGFLGHMALVWALMQAEASALAPFNYSGLIFATVLGLAVFGEVPDVATMVGAAIIVGSGIFVWYRERVTERQP